MLVGRFLIGGPWNLAIYGKGFQHQVFLDNLPFASERVPVFKFLLCPDSLVPWGGARLWFPMQMDRGGTRAVLFP